MSDHVLEWLGAYRDGELHGSRLQQVEAHLAECEICQRELEALENITSWLQEAPAAEFTSPERFAAQVHLRLPYSKPAPSSRNLLEVGWWMIPVGLLAAWGFIATTYLVNDLLSFATNFGWLSGVSDWLWSGAPAAANWSMRLAQAGVLSGRSLELAVSTESFTRTALPQIGLQIAIALLYLSWVAIWWAHYRRQLTG